MVQLIPSGRGHNYTGPLTRSIVFLSVLLIFLAATVLTILAITTPDWLSYTSTHSHTTIRETLGLHSRCTNTAHPPSDRSFLTLKHHESTLKCTPYPRYTDCQSTNRYFCSMWRTTGFLMSFSVVLEGMAIAAFVVLLLGGKQKREQGWGFMATLTVLSALVQAVAMGIVSYLKDNDEKFSVPGWERGRSWDMCTASWSLQGFVAVAITLAALYLPSEGGYELIPDRQPYDDEEDDEFRGRIV